MIRYFKDELWILNSNDWWLSSCCSSVIEHWWLMPRALAFTFGDCWVSLFSAITSHLLNSRKSLSQIIVQQAVSPSWLGRSWPGSTFAATAMSWTARSRPLPGRGSGPWSSSGRTWLWSLLAGRPRSGLWPPSLGTVGVRCVSGDGRSGTRPSAWTPGMRSPSTWTIMLR